MNRKSGTYPVVVPHRESQNNAEKIFKINELHAKMVERQMDAK
jgi:hypothetical protein